MSELKLPRLLAAAKEFNVGQDTLIEFLGKKGFPKDDLKPTAKLTEEQYYALQAEFQSDKVARNKADHVELPKNAVSKPEAAKVADAVAKPAPVIPVVAEPAKVVAEVPVVAAAPVHAPIVLETPIAAAPVKMEAPEMEAPKVINKIDLSLIDSSTRPKKTVKKVEEAAPKANAPKASEAPKAAAKKAEPAPAPTPAPKAAPVDHSIAPENVHGAITNIQADKLTGPKILGKIELPINSDTRPKPMTQEEKRIRKRIPVPGRPNLPNQGPGGQTQGGGGGYQGNRPQGGSGGYQGNRPQGGGGGYQGNRPNNRPGQSSGPRGRNMPQTAEQKEIDQKAIQDKIKETQAKLSGQGGRGKSMKSKYRRQRREEAAENDNNEARDTKLQVTEFVTVSELSSLMDVSFADIISKCMNLGIMVSINQRLDAEVIELVASEF